MLRRRPLTDESSLSSLLTAHWSLLTATLVALALLFSGCKSVEVVKEVPVVTEHRTVEHRLDVVRDTLMMRDSVYHYVMGDTVIIEKWHQTIKVDRVLVADTVRDTIPKVVTVTQTVTKSVEKPLHWWQKALMCLGALATTIATAWLLFKLKH